MMAKTGAKPKFNVPRYESGQIKHGHREPKAEKPEKVMAVALAQPHRRGERSHLAGFEIGRLLMSGQISDRQFAAAEIYTRRAVRYMRAITGTLPRLPCTLGPMLKRDLADQRAQDTLAKPTAIHDAPMNEVEATAAARSDYAEIHGALADAGLFVAFPAGVFPDANTILTRVCIMDKEPMNSAEMGALRSSLNAIANRLRLS
jgi:hypothetical protein